MHPCTRRIGLVAVRSDSRASRVCPFDAVSFEPPLFALGRSVPRLARLPRVAAGRGEAKPSRQSGPHQPGLDTGPLRVCVSPAVATDCCGANLKQRNQLIRI